MSEKLNPACNASLLIIIFFLLPFFGEAQATTGIPSLRGLYIATLYFAGLIAAGLLLAGIYLKHKGKRSSAWVQLLVAIPAIYTALLAMACISGLSSIHATAYESIANSILFFIFSVSVLFFYIDSRISRKYILLVSVIILIALNVFSPGVVSYRFYTFVDNEPLANANDTITVSNPYYIELSDGTMLTNGKPVYINGYHKAFVEKIAPDRRGDLPGYRISIKQELGNYVGTERYIYRRDINALIKIPLREIKRNNYVARVIGTYMAVDGKTATNVRLFDAARTCAVDKVVDLIESGADVNYRPEKNLGSAIFATPIYTAINSLCPEVVEVLIKNGSKLNVANEDLESPLHVSAYDRTYLAIHGSYDRDEKLARQVEIIARLVNAGANLNSLNKKNESPLHIAAKNRLTFTKLLAEAGADTGIEDNEGNTALDASKKYFEQFGNKAEGRKIIEYLEQFTRGVQSNNS